MSKLDLKQFKSILKAALAEDIKKHDLTSKIIVPKDLKIRAQIVLKESGVIAGLEVAKQVFKIRNKNIKFIPKVKDGTFIKSSTKRRKKIIAKIQGNARNILEAERSALNFLSHLSGIATLTNQFVKRVKGYNVKITDTRKTTPNLRYLEKYAVRAGGGYNHRKGLYDRILIKGNHIETVRKSPAECVLIAKRKTKKLIEVEVKKISQFRDTLSAGADTIMLDNMSLDDIKKAIKIKKDYLRKNKNKKAPQIEVSGNVKLSNVRKIAGCAVDFISIGALTHSNPSLDMTLKVK